MIGKSLAIKRNYISLILDSGASDQMIKYINLFDSFIHFKTQIEIAVAKCDTNIKATAKGIDSYKQ